MLTVQRIKTSQVLEFQIAEEHETVIIMPCIRMTMALRAADVLVGRTQASGLLVLAEDDCRLGFIATANYIYAKTQSKYVAYVAQDAFAGYYWMENALEAIKKHKAGLLAFNDGRFFGRIAAFGMVDREWTNSLYGNFLFHPHYKKHYADTELSDIALLTEKLIYNPHCMVIEVDYEKHRGQSSALQETVIRYEEPPTNDPDGVLYVKRALAGFDGKVKPFVPEMGPVKAVLQQRVNEIICSSSDKI